MPFGVWQDRGNTWVGLAVAKCSLIFLNDNRGDAGDLALLAFDQLDGAFHCAAGLDPLVNKQNPRARGKCRLAHFHFLNAAGIILERNLVGVDAEFAGLANGQEAAVEAGGNCPLSKLDQVVKTKNGITIIGHGNVAGRLAEDASALFAKNLLNFITPLVDPETKTLAIDWEDEIVTGTLVTRDGKVVHPMLTNKKPGKKPTKKPAGKAKKPASNPKPKGK